MGFFTTPGEYQGSPRWFLLRIFDNDHALAFIAVGTTRYIPAHKQKHNASIFNPKNEDIVLSKTLKFKTNDIIQNVIHVPRNKNLYIQLYRGRNILAQFFENIYIKPKMKPSHLLITENACKHLQVNVG